MSWKSFKKIAKRVFTPGHISRKQFKSVRKHLGMTSKNKHVRNIRRRLQNVRSDAKDLISYDQPTSASTVYQYDGKTLSQLTGGV